MVKTKKYVKKPVLVEAVLLTEENLKEVEEWITEETGDISSALADKKRGWLLIETPEGTLTAYVNEHYIVKGVKGEFYPVEKEIFEETYEECESSPKLILYEDDLVNLDYAIAKIVLAGLEKIKKSPFYPSHLSSQEWEKVLEEIEKGFKILFKLKDGKYDDLPEEEIKEKLNRVNRAFELICKYWRWLWK